MAVAATASAPVIVTNECDHLNFRWWYIKLERKTRDSTKCFSFRICMMLNKDLWSIKCCWLCHSDVKLANKNAPQLTRFNDRLNNCLPRKTTATVKWNTTGLDQIHSNTWNTLYGQIALSRLNNNGSLNYQQLVTGIKLRRKTYYKKQIALITTVAWRIANIMGSV